VPLRHLRRIVIISLAYITHKKHSFFNGTLVAPVIEV
jgi:hypothetical protein